MSLISNTVFRDNIRGNRLIPVSEKVTAVIDTAPFQRLRYIKQMGLSSFVFPTAEHSRFSHSLGVYATARETFGSLKKKAERLTIPFPAMRFDDVSEEEFCLAAMCHDIGHTAFSHVLEDLLLPHPFRDHEDCTLDVILNNKELSSAISNAADIDAVTLMIKKEHPNRALASLVSGMFDVDRCDYLIRDSQNAGVLYGLYDFSWLLHALSVDVNELYQPILILDGPRGLDALRQFFAARRHMYRQVYLQPTIRAAQLLLRAIFERIKDRPLTSDLCGVCPAGLANFLTGKHVTQSDLLNTSDIEIIYLVRILSESSNDSVLRNMSKMFCSRRFPKAVLDSAKTHEPLGNRLEIDFKKSDSIYEQMSLLPGGPIEEAVFLEECRDIVAKEMTRKGEDPELARYLVFSERVRFKAGAESDIVFMFQQERVPLSLLNTKSLGVGLPDAIETFELYRLFAPTEYRDILRAHLDTYQKRRRSSSGN